MPLSRIGPRQIAGLEVEEMEGQSRPMKLREILRGRGKRVSDRPGPVPASTRRDRALEAALARDEIEVRFQPQIEPVSGRIRGVEALARWPGAGPGSPVRARRGRRPVRAPVANNPAQGAAYRGQMDRRARQTRPVDQPLAARPRTRRLRTMAACRNARRGPRSQPGHRGNRRKRLAVRSPGGGGAAQLPPRPGRADRGR